MRRYSPAYDSPPRRGYGGSPPRRGYGGSPPRRGYGGRGRSPPRRKYGGYGGHREQNGGSLLVRNIPLNCRPEDLRVPFERFGRVRDVYLPKDYYSGEPRGFAFVEFVDPYDASEAQYYMNRQHFGGREITVVVASETRKRPEDMRYRARSGGLSSYDGRRSSGYGRSRSRSRSRSPNGHPSSRVRRTSRSYSPAPRRHDDYSASPRRRRSSRSRSPRDYPDGRKKEGSRRSYSPEDRKRADIGYEEKPRHDGEGKNNDPRSPSPRHTSRSPSGSRSRSADLSPGNSR